MKTAFGVCSAPINLDGGLPLGWKRELTTLSMDEAVVMYREIKAEASSLAVVLVAIIDDTAVYPVMFRRIVGKLESDAIGEDFFNSGVQDDFVVASSTLCPF